MCEYGSKAGISSGIDDLKICQIWAQTINLECSARCIWCWSQLV